MARGHFRHKTKKVPFQIVCWAVAVGRVWIVAAVLYALVARPW